MFCAKCGKEIPDGEKKICEECEKSLVSEIVAEEKEEIKKEEKVEEAKKEKKEKKEKKINWKISDKKDFIKKCAIAVIGILLVILIVCLISKFASNGNVGNTIGNIRNYGYATENDGWIYYLSPNEDSSKIGIFKIRNNGKDQQQLYMSDMDIVSLNAYKGYLYFIGTATETYQEDDKYDNKIYRMKTNGSNIEILNDNELNNECYEIYVVDNSIYYIGLNAEICKMDLDGANKTVVADNKTGYLGITDKYIVYNNSANENDTDYVTYIMNLDGTDAKPIVEGKRLYSVNVEGKEVYYSDANKKLYKTEIGSNKEETLYENIEMYNLNTDNGYAYYLNYLDADNGDYTVCLFRVKLDGSTETPEKLKEMDTYSSFIDVVGKWVIYMDSSDEAGVIKLINKNGNGDEVELYRLDYAAIYENLDIPETEKEEFDEPNETEEDVPNESVTNEVTTNEVVNENVAAKVADVKEEQ